MPSLGADMDEGTLLEWLVRPGDPVHRGDAVAVVDTSKAAIEVECFEEGVVDDLLVQPGTRVPVGTPLARISTDGAVPGAVPAPQVTVPVPPTVAAPPSHGEHVTASPLVRRLAAEAGVDVETVHGTGRGGRVTRADVQGAAAAAARASGPAPKPRRPVTTPPEPAEAAELRRVTPYARRLAAELGVDLATVVTRGGPHEPVRAADVRAAAGGPSTPPAAPRAPAVPALAAPTAPTAPTAPPPRAGAAAGIRDTIARLMARSKREIPHYYLTQTVDLQAALAWMGGRNRELPVGERLLPAALLLRATALAVRDVPALNGFWVDGAFVPGPGVHLGVAVSLRGGGLVAPAIHDADRLGVVELMAALKNLALRVRAGTLRGSELSDPTITVTNLGDQGVESVQGVIHPPQVALVGFGQVQRRPWAVDGLIGVRPLVVATLAADHRATDGFTGARLLDRIDRLLQRPEEL
jgi:pyruvate dehydrogenase E2 component (dihydrolipoamide acetyltransferase)